MQIPISLVQTLMSFTLSTGFCLSIARRFFQLAKDTQLYGILSLEDLKKLSRENWHKTQIQTVMRPITPEYSSNQTCSFPKRVR